MNEAEWQTRKQRIDTRLRALQPPWKIRQFDADAVERDITAPDSNRKIIKGVAKYAYEHEATTGHVPKILIFAVNDIPHTSHADQFVKTCRDVFNQGDDFVKKIPSRRISPPKHHRTRGRGGRSSTPARPKWWPTSSSA